MLLAAGILILLENCLCFCNINGTWGNSGDPTSGATITGALTLNTGDEYDGFMFMAVISK